MESPSKENCNTHNLPIPFKITSHAANVQNQCHYYQDQEYKEPTFLSKHDNEWQRDKHAADFTPMKSYDACSAPHAGKVSSQLDISKALAMVSSGFVHVKA